MKKLSRRDLQSKFGAGNFPAYLSGDDQGGGGRPCSVAVQQPNGSWITYPGTCAFVLGNTNSNGVTTHGSYYCDTGIGNHYAITSNGGVSRCG